ncbi:Uncharacterised protein [Mycobacteroides abscessus]|nr:Uncharacterised protein [Mycobacteroides abscessus]CPS25077.1 Uncharacterised protein [Mycobacteroides abscessus]CPS79020.1 Uncharacterised protein [Mycobacteroides abscessus]CPS88995.1 Uncharacterised protein [Mycobacteroides abscessus]CPW74738.1 Uncharacterised protein [Mycobacteroides abscessus]
MRRAMAPPHYRPILVPGVGGAPLGVTNAIAPQCDSSTLSDMSTTAVRFTLATLSTLTVALGVYVVPTTHPHADARSLPTCEYEDGNTNGMPCNWTDPDTGTAYLVSSENYR